MTNECEIITFRNDRSQVLNYSHPGHNMIASKSFYSPDMNVHVPEHWHEELEFIYVVEGRLLFSVNGEEIVLNEGESIFVNSKRIHSNGSPKGEYCVFYFGLAHPSILSASPYIEQKYVTPLLGSGSADYILLHETEWGRKIINHIVDTFENTTSDLLELRTIELLYAFVRILYENCPPQITPFSTTATYSNNFKAMVTYISEHYSEKISLNEISEAGNVGKTLCAKIFRQFSSKTPGDYLIHYRINKSASLLTGSTLSITEIAYQTGFNSPSHYTKTFREVIGCTPNHFRSAKY